MLCYLSINQCAIDKEILMLIDKQFRIYADNLPFSFSPPIYHTLTPVDLVFLGMIHWGMPLLKLLTADDTNNRLQKGLLTQLFRGQKLIYLNA